MHNGRPCENPKCRMWHYGKFGSGRFCSYRCSRSAGGRARGKHPFSGPRGDWKGKKHKPETRKKMSKSAKRTWNDLKVSLKRTKKWKRDENGRFTKATD